MRPQFETLRETLLRAGIAPRHVRRYLDELGHHFDDIVREEAAKGSPRAEAETVAQARLGSEDALAAALLDRPGLRSISARFPWAVFGLGPVATLLLVLIAAALLEGWFLELLSRMFGPQLGGSFTRDPDWLRTIIWIWNQLIMYVAPLVVAALIVYVGGRQRIGLTWIVVGVILAGAAGSALFMETSWVDEPGDRAELIVKFAGVVL
jgi:hypothetical protein